MTGTTDKAKGKIKEGVGKVTGDRRTEAEGKSDQIKGDVKDAGHKVKESVKDAADDLKR